MEEWKKLDEWIRRRERKLETLEKLSRGLDNDADESSPEPLIRLSEELDNDLSYYGSKMILFEISSLIMSCPIGFATAPSGSESENDYTTARRRTIGRRPKSAGEKESSRVPPEFIYRDKPAIPVTQLIIPSQITRPANPNLLRQELKELTNQQRSMETAYDQHGQWLLSLRKELTSYHHGSENSSFPTKKVASELAQAIAMNVI